MLSGGPLPPPPVPALTFESPTLQITSTPLPVRADNYDLWFSSDGGTNWDSYDGYAWASLVEVDLSGVPAGTQFKVREQGDDVVYTGDSAFCEPLTI